MDLQRLRTMAFTQNPYDNVYLNFNSLKQANYIIDTILQKGAEVLYDKYLVSQQPYYLSEDIIHWHDAFMQQEYVKVDKGESRFNLQNRWIPENEPVASLPTSTISLCIFFFQPQPRRAQTR